MGSDGRTGREPSSRRWPDGSEALPGAARPSRRSFGPLVAAALWTLAACAGTGSAPAPPASQEPGPWRVLFDGADLSDWEAGVFGEDPEFDLVDGGVVLPQGVPLAGLTYRGAPPEGPFEAEFDVTKEYGADFFLAVTFPAREAHLTLVLGGWGGVVCGLSCLDGEDASGNDTRTLRSFPDGTRYRVGLRVSDAEVQVDLDGERLLAAPLEGRVLSIRPEVEPSVPFGVASFATQTILHGVRVRHLAPSPAGP